MPTYANQSAYPLAPPTVSGSNVTVSMMLAEPSRISRYLADIRLRNFISPLLFANPAGVAGGALVVDEEPEIVGVAVARRRRVVAADLVTPRASERMLGDGQQLDVGEADGERVIGPTPHLARA